MYGLTRGALTLIGVAVAGFLIWIGIDAVAGEESPSSGEYWWAALLIAAAGLVIALSQLLGGWTKWGWPRISGNVFLLGFLPALIAGLWIVNYGDPGEGWVADRARNWADDLGIEGLVGDLSEAWTAIAFGVGLVFGLTFDTTGPRTERVGWRRRGGVQAGGAVPDTTPQDGEPGDRRVHIRGSDAPEGAPRAGEPPRKE
jgi:hypothetical protein